MGALILYLSISVIVALIELGMHVKVWLYAIKAIGFILFTINLPICGLGKITGYRFSFWIFAIHYWLDHFLGAFIGNRIEWLAYQFTTWVVVCGIGIISGLILEKVMPRFFSILNGYRVTVPKNY